MLRKVVFIVIKLNWSFMFYCAKKKKKKEKGRWRSLVLRCGAFVSPSDFWHQFKQLLFHILCIFSHKCRIERTSYTVFIITFSLVSLSKPRCVTLTFDLAIIWRQALYKEMLKSSLHKLFLKIWSNDPKSDFYFILKGFLFEPRAFQHPHLVLV